MGVERFGIGTEQRRITIDRDEVDDDPITLGDRASARQGDVVCVARVDAPRLFGKVHEVLVQPKADHVRKHRAARRSLG